MASIERTAYPRLKQNLTKTELRDFYTPTSEEIEFVRQTARKQDTQLHLLVHLKLFGQLGYFLNIEDVPELLISHLQSALQLSPKIIPVVIQRTLYRHHNFVREFLHVKGYDRTAHKLITGLREEKCRKRRCAYNNGDRFRLTSGNNRLMAVIWLV